MCFVERPQAVDQFGFRRGQRTAVCDKTFGLLGREPYHGMFEMIEPDDAVAPEEAKPFDCHRTRLRHPRETKSAAGNKATEDLETCCGDGQPCC